MEFKHIAVGVALMISLLTLGLADEVGDYSPACVMAGMLLMYVLIEVVKGLVNFYHWYHTDYLPLFEA